MSQHVQRNLIVDRGSRVTIEHNHRLGLVFVAFAAIPMLVPFRSTSASLGAAATLAGALAFALAGIGYFLRRRKLELDLAARRCTVTRGVWPALDVAESPLERILDVELAPRARRGRETWALSLVLDTMRFSLWETDDREEALDGQRHWRERIAPRPAPGPERRAAA